MQLQDAVNDVFVQLSTSLEQLTTEQYQAPCSNLSNNSIGQHVRHIIEMFQCLQDGYPTGKVNYEKRKRDIRIETDKVFALDLLKQIHQNLQVSNKEILLEASFDDTSNENLAITTNFNREVLYNLEHTIHHMALIRVGILQLTTIKLPESFGVAASTIKYKKACAQ
jgi:hypothetical protein